MCTRRCWRHIQQERGMVSSQPLSPMRLPRLLPLLNHFLQYLILFLPDKSKAKKKKKKKQDFPSWPLPSAATPLFFAFLCSKTPRKGALCSAHCSTSQRSSVGSVRLGSFVHSALPLYLGSEKYLAPGTTPFHPPLYSPPTVKTLQLSLLPMGLFSSERTLSGGNRSP